MNLSDVIGIDWLDPWEAVNNPSTARALEAELAVETNPQHVLFGASTAAVARRVGQDDWLFFVGGSPPRLAVVHLTFRNEQEQFANIPWTTFYETVDDFLARCMLPQHAERSRWTSRESSP